MTKEEREFHRLVRQVNRQELDERLSRIDQELDDLRDPTAPDPPRWVVWTARGIMWMGVICSAYFTYLIIRTIWRTIS